MLKKKKKLAISLLAASILSSSAASAANFYYPNITYSNNYNRGYAVNYYYDYSPIENYPQWTWTVVNTSPVSRPGTIIQLPERPSTPNVPSEPAPSRPVETPVETPAETPTRPSQPSRPVEPTNPAPSPSISGLSAIEAEVVRLVNVERQKEGLRPLEASLELSNVARKKSEDMGKNNYFNHNSPTYGSPFDMMKSFGIKYGTAGENIAKGQLSAQSVVRAWMNSSGHRANIMNSSFTKIGVGYYQTSNGTNYWTQMFTN
ncbi:MAG: CAP domain-containing protein [Tissierellaceae bacterium]